MAVATIDRAGVTAAAGQRFYVRMAVICLAVALVGFAPTYWIPMLRGTLTIAPLAHLHAVFFYGWLVLFITQTGLAASGRYIRHQELGVFGVAVATGMCFVGLGAAVHSIHRFEAAGMGVTARQFSIVPVTGAALFAALFAVALIKVNNPDVHKRVLLVATVSLLQAPAGRWFGLFLAPPLPPGFSGPAPQPPVAATILPGLLVDTLIVAAMVRDRRTRGRVHRAYWIAGGIVLAVQLVRAPLSTSSAWMRVADALVALAP
jgi:hypothetical protein